MNILINKVKEVLYSVLPITIIVLILNFTITPLGTTVLIKYILGTFLIIIGLSIFFFGVDIGITPIGTLMGSSITKTNSLVIVTISGLVLGFLISIAEPDLHILADQVELVTSGLISKMSIIIVVSIGIAVMLSAGLIRIVYNFPLYKALSIIYLLIMILSFFSTSEFLAISFDASGATTGAMTVPFILALALGVSSLKKDSKASEKDSFGLVALASSGAIIAVLLMSIISKTDKISADMEMTFTENYSILESFLREIPIVSRDIIIALLPLLLLFLIFQKISFKISRREFKRILKGLLYTFIGLVLFLTGVNAGFMDVGRIVGYNLASFDNKGVVVIVGFILGLVTVLAEPAVHVLVYQIEEVTSGYVKRSVVLFALSIGIALSVSLSVIRILIPRIQLWHYLLPGYIISIVLTYLVPKLFVGIAFDAGGVASGPMTATFILAFTQGIANAIESANVLIDGFGIIAMVALTPLITLQVLGLVFKIKSKRRDIA